MILKFAPVHDSSLVIALVSLVGDRFTYGINWYDIIRRGRCNCEHRVYQRTFS